jgi:hypothetical protein
MSSRNWATCESACAHLQLSAVAAMCLIDDSWIRQPSLGLQVDIKAMYIVAHMCMDAARDAVCDLPGDDASVHTRRFGYAGLPWTNFVSIDDDGAYSPPNAVITNSPFSQMGCGRHFVGGDPPSCLPGCVLAM